MDEARLFESIVRQEVRQMMFPDRRQGMRPVAARLVVNRQQDVATALDLPYRRFQDAELRRVHLVVGRVDRQERRLDF